MSSKDFENREMDVESSLKRYVPNIFQLLEPERIAWADISKGYKKKVLSRMKELEEKGTETISVETSFLDIVTQLLNGKDHYYNLYYFINDMMFADFIQLMTAEERKLVKTTIYNLVVQFNRTYRNYVGELAVLWIYKKQGWTLLRVEEPIDNDNPKGTSIDFTLVKDNKGGYVEVVNIELNEKNTFDDEIISKHITGKIEKKLADYAESKKPVFLIPVIWGEYAMIKKVSDWWESNKIKIKDVSNLMAFQSYSASDGEQQVRFGYIKHLIPLTNPTDETAIRS